MAKKVKKSPPKVEGVPDGFSVLYDTEDACEVEYEGETYSVEDGKVIVPNAAIEHLLKHGFSLTPEE